MTRRLIPTLALTPNPSPYPHLTATLCHRWTRWTGTEPLKSFVGVLYYSPPLTLPPLLDSTQSRQMNCGLPVRYSVDEPTYIHRIFSPSKRSWMLLKALLEGNSYRVRSEWDQWQNEPPPDTAGRQIVEDPLMITPSFPVSLSRERWGPLQVTKAECSGLLWHWSQAVGLQTQWHPLHAWCSDWRDAWKPHWVTGTGLMQSGAPSLLLVEPLQLFPAYLCCGYSQWGSCQSREMWALGSCPVTAFQKDREGRIERQ